MAELQTPAAPSAPDRSTGPEARRAVAFAALRHRDFAIYLLTSGGGMMFDNVEHVVTYWVLFEEFHSPLLGGYAVISHWLPFLLFSVHSGALADRFYCRRLIQSSQLLFALVSLAWGVLFLTDSLQVWHAVVLLTLHGLAGVIWGPAGQLIIHDMVGPDHLQSAVRLNSTTRQFGQVFGPAIGGGMMLAIGPGLGMLVNALLYLPGTVWLHTVPYTGHGREAPGRRPPSLGLRSTLGVLRDVSHTPALLAMVLLSGLNALLVGNAFQAQMPEFASLLGAETVGITYGALQTAPAVGAVIGGIVLESGGLLRPSPRTAVIAAALWAAAIAGFALASNYLLALGLLCLAGAFRLTFQSMAQTLVQLLAPSQMRGRIVGVFSMSLGLQAGSGVTVGVLGSIIGVQASLAISGMTLLVGTGLLFMLVLQQGRAEHSSNPEPNIEASRPGG